MPAVTDFTFSLDDGSTGSGSFDYTDSQVDAALASQQIAAFDVQIAINGQPVVVEDVLSAARGSFSRGELLGLSFAYDVACGDYDALSVANDTAVAVLLGSNPTPGTTTVLNSSITGDSGNAASDNPLLGGGGGMPTAGILVLGTTTVVGVPPRGPIPDAPRDVVQIDPAAAVQAFNANLADLAALVRHMEQGMTDYDSFQALSKEMWLKERIATSTIQAAVCRLMGSVYLREWRGSYLVLEGLQAEYDTRYDEVMTQRATLMNLLPPEWRAQLNPIGPRYGIPINEYTPPPGYNPL